MSTENILRLVREAHALTQKDFAELVGVSPQAIMRYEQALYEQLSPKITTQLAELSGLPEETIKMKYSYNRLQIQRDAYRYLMPLPALHIVEGEHPFYTFRTYITKRYRNTDSRMAFCILLALHPAVVAKYDSGEVKRMPELITNGLITTGINTDFIHGLQALGEIWYERRNS